MEMKAADLIRLDQAELIREINMAIVSQAPHLARTIDGADTRLRRLRRAVLHSSVAGFADYLDVYPDGTAVAERDAHLHRDLGRMEARYGRPLADVLRAPWAASSTIWRHAVSRASEVGLSVEQLHLVAEAVIAWSDRLSSAFSEGYNDETTARSAEAEMHRHRLVRMLLAPSPVDRDRLQTVADDAGWLVPPRVRVLLTSGEGRDRLRRRLPRESLVGDLDGHLTVVAPDSAHGQLVTLDPGVGVAAALGPAVDVDDARLSAAAARTGLALVTAAILPGGAVLDCDDHDLSVLLLAEPTAATRFAVRRIAPIAARPDLVDTLAAWLRHHGRPKATAAELGVHPHTVSYRLERLRELLGPIVDDPQRHTELVVALSITQLRRTPSVQSPSRPGTVNTTV